MMQALDNIIWGFLIFLFGFGTFAAARAYYYQVHLGCELEKDLGFRLGTVTYPVGWWLKKKVAIDEVVEGGVFARAGFHPLDVLPDVSLNGFCRLLHQSRGRTAEVAILSRDVSPPFKGPKRVIRFVTVHRPGTGSFFPR